MRALFHSIIVAVAIAAVNAAAVVSAGGIVSGGTPLSLSLTNSADLRGLLSDESGTGAAIFAGGALGAATATTINGLTLNGNTSTLTISAAKTLTVSNTLSLTATDGSTLAIGTGGTLGTAAYTASGDYVPIASLTGGGVLATGGFTLTVPATGTAIISGGALGTPSSGTATNITGLPVAGIAASTVTALGVGSLELGHATDTTIARSGAGAITVEGVAALLSGGALGTPSSGVATNITGLPAASVLAGTFGAGSYVMTGSLTSNALTSGRVPIVSTSGLIADNARLLWDNTANTEALSVIGNKTFAGENAALIVGNASTTNSATRIGFNGATSGNAYCIFAQNGTARYTTGITTAGDWAVYNYGLASYNIVALLASGRIGLYGVTAPTGFLHLPAGLAAASGAPLKFTSGTNLTSAEAGAVEWDGTNLFVTQTAGPTRQTLAFLTANTFVGDQTLGDAVNIIVNATTGSKLATANTQKLGFWGVTPVVQPSAYTQTYATATKTHSNMTSADVGAFTGGVTGFLDAAERDNLRTQINALRADLINLKGVVNSLIDDGQSIGTAQ